MGRRPHGHGVFFFGAFLVGCEANYRRHAVSKKKAAKWYGRLRENEMMNGVRILSVLFEFLCGGDGKTVTALVVGVAVVTAHPDKGHFVDVQKS